MKRVFVDTGGFVALLVAEDKMHELAASLFETASREHWSGDPVRSVISEF
jgi:predicted nucleic acid-binding protein